MIQKSISLSETDWKNLARQAKKRGISVRELIRRILYGWLEAIS